ncbi:MAG: hypothetical protein N2315_05825 [Thermanaerothrix sp.]|nr:hypothetical protein [Thermanaerothrix sp.]
MKDPRHCVLLLGKCDNRSRCGWNCMLLANEDAPALSEGKGERQGKPGDSKGVKGK